MYPRGKYRSWLARSGLIGKLHLTSIMTDEEVTSEICTVFKEQMNNNPNFLLLIYNRLVVDRSH